MTQKHYRHFSPERPEVRAADDGRPTIAGYAAVFNSRSNDLGGFFEIIRPGAFRDSLASKPDVSARIQHEGGLMTIGRTTNGSLRIHEDKRGLFYEVTPPDTQAGRDIVELVRGGYIDRSSFAFTLRGDRESAEKWHFDQEPPLRELLRLELHDVAPVDGPAYEATSVQARALAMKSLDAARAGGYRDQSLRRKAKMLRLFMQ